MTHQPATLHRFYLFVMLTFTALLSCATVSAHEIRPAIVDINLQQDGTLQASIRVNLEAMIAEIGPEHQDTDESDNAVQYNKLRGLQAGELTKSFNGFTPDFLEKLQITTDQGSIKLAVTDISIPEVGDIELSRDSVVTLSGTLPSTATQLKWGWDKNLGANAVRVSAYQKPDLYTAYLKDGKQTDWISLDGLVTQSAWGIFANYTVVGFEHILPKGLDHILFVVGLFLLSLKLSSLLWQVTSFTLAHSVTLALGILGYVSISPAIVEPLIALSITYVCVENIISEKLHRWRPILIFSFGLLHGLGFASVLGEIGLNQTHFITGLVAFNIGIELGQLTVIAICFILIGVWFRHKDWYRSRITIPLSAVIAAIGAYWFVERAFF